MEGMVDVYKNKRVLITGHTGFKGSWLAYWMQKMGAEVYGLSHPPRSKPNHYRLISLHHLLKMDIHADISLLEEINCIDPHIVFHLASRAIVSETFKHPESAFQATIMGAVHILELCRQCPSVQGIVMITSDKVYQPREWNYAYREIDRLGDVTPYGTSKVCVEHIVKCYRESFGMNIAVARAGNVIGGGDWSENRLLPDIARATSEGKPVIVHTPQATRPFQHVLDALAGYLILGRNILEGKDVNRAWNFGPDGEMTVDDVLKTAQAVWPKIKYKVDSAPTHPHMVYLLKIDSTESKKLLGWRPVWDMQHAVLMTTLWYKIYYNNGDIMTDTDIRDYLSSAEEVYAEYP